MSRAIRWSSLLAGLLFLAAPLHAQDKNKNKPNGKGVNATPQESQQVLAAGQITGKVAEIDHAKRLITVVVEVQSVQPQEGNQAAQNAARQQQLARQIYQRPNQNQNPIQQARKLQQQAAQALRPGGGVKLQMVKKEFEFQAAEKAPVRLLNLPQEFDDRGKPKAYTAAELRELKGSNTSLPGYQSSFENLSPGQVVKLHVVSARRASSAVLTEKPKGGDADNEKNAPPAAVAADPTKPRATMILIVQDEAGTGLAKGKPKKK
jgi:hypothetical protein